MKQPSVFSSTKSTFYRRTNTRWRCRSQFIRNAGLSSSSGWWSVSSKPVAPRREKLMPVRQGSSFPAAKKRFRPSSASPAGSPAVHAAGIKQADKHRLGSCPPLKIWERIGVTMVEWLHSRMLLENAPKQFVMSSVRILVSSLSILKWTVASSCWVKAFRRRSKFSETTARSSVSASQLLRRLSHSASARTACSTCR